MYVPGSNRTLKRPLEPSPKDGVVGDLKVYSRVGRTDYGVLSRTRSWWTDSTPTRGLGIFDPLLVTTRRRYVLILLLKDEKDRKKKVPKRDSVSDIMVYPQ